MGRVLKFWRLSSAKRRRLLVCFVMLAGVRGGLWVLPFRTLQGGLARLEGGIPTLLGQPSAREIGHLVRTASRFVPGASCLVRALVGQVLLGQCGHPATLRIGVARDNNKGLEAHAWIECRGQVVIGALPDLSRYTALPSVERMT